MEKLRNFWNSLTTFQAVLLGVALGLSLDVFPHALWGIGPFKFGFILYFPFHAWLIVSLFRVLFSQDARTELLGEGYSFWGAFFGYMTSKYALFCLSWLFTIWIFAAIVIGV